MKGISFPNCQLCGIMIIIILIVIIIIITIIISGNKLSEDGIDGESALEDSIGINTNTIIN